MTIRFTHVRLSGGSEHEHITHLWWTEDGSGKTGVNTRAELVSSIEGGVKAYVQDSWGHKASVGVVTPSFGAKYLRTHADGKWTNNLLSLPRA